MASQTQLYLLCLHGYKAPCTWNWVWVEIFEWKRIFIEFNACAQMVNADMKGLCNVWDTTQKAHFVYFAIVFSCMCQWDTSTAHILEISSKHRS